MIYKPRAQLLQKKNKLTVLCGENGRRNQGVTVSFIVSIQIIYFSTCLIDVSVPFFMTVNNVICAWICFISFEHYRCYAISIIVVDCIAVWRIVYTCIKLVEKERLMFKISSNMLHSVLSRFITVRQVCLLHRDEPTCTRNFKNSANQKHSMKNILNFFFFSNHQ